MPRSRRVLSRRVRLRSSMSKVRSLALDIEEPLNDAADHVHALRLIGHGIMLDDAAEGRAIATIAWAASDRLDRLRTIWKQLHKTART